MDGFNAAEVLAIGNVAEYAPSTGFFDGLSHFLDNQQRWAFGHFGYDLKNELENLTSNLPDRIGFPVGCFFIPEFVVFLKGNGARVIYQGGHMSPNEVSDLFLRVMEAPSPVKQPNPAPTVQHVFSKEEYLERVMGLKRHIQRGDIYEVNFCQEFFAEDADVGPFELFQALYAHSPNPFSAFYKLGNRYLMCASPERFLCHSNGKLVSQPIKGTAPRGRTLEEDRMYREALRTSEKDRRENVMITDLVRNDLSRHAVPGTVEVEELYGIYTYPQVHQMITTVTASLQPELHPVEAIRAAFPMGSMTGAPKVRAMQLIEDFEVSRRGLFSGAVGFFSPGLDFDFNVVIRSLFYNADTATLSYQVGGAITDLSDPHEEYAESLLKAKAIREILQSH